MAYSKEFAQVYDETFFTEAAAAELGQWLQVARAVLPAGAHVLDLGCGTGYLLDRFADAGFTGTGIDLSEDMLAVANQKRARHVLAGRLSFLCGDISRFTSPVAPHLIVSTGHALHHLRFDQLRTCFEASMGCLQPEGYFAFNLLTRGVPAVRTIDTDAHFQLATFGAVPFDRPERTILSHARVGFIRRPDGSWARYDETFPLFVFDLRDVRAALFSAGAAGVSIVEWKAPRLGVPVPEDQDGSAIPNGADILVIASRAQKSPLEALLPALAASLSGSKN